MSDTPETDDAAARFAAVERFTGAVYVDDARRIEIERNRIRAEIAALRRGVAGGASVKKPNTEPKTPYEWSAYRCQLSCKLGRDALEGKAKAPAGVTPLEYAVFNLLHAVEELSRSHKIGRG